MFSAGIIAENFEVFENYIFDFKILCMEFCWFPRSATLEVRFLRLFIRAPCLPVVTAESRQPLFLKNWRISAHLSL